MIVTDGELKCVRDGDMSTHYLLNWTEPENIDKFDLDYYEVTVIISNGPRQTLHFSNTSAIINLGLTTSEVDVVAVSRCGERGPSNPRPITVGQCTTATYPECTSSSSTKPNFSMSVTIIVLMLLINIIYS